jgi:hypothetical protein
MGAPSCGSRPWNCSSVWPLISPPRIHRHRYHGVLAPNVPQRAQVIARQPPLPIANVADAAHAPVRSQARYLWALLLARIYEVFPLRCALCRRDAHHCLRHRRPVDPLHPHLLGRAHYPPEVARGPPLWDPVAEPVANWDDAPAHVPEFVFDQRLS